MSLGLEKDGLRAQPLRAPPDGAPQLSASRHAASAEQLGRRSEGPLGPRRAAQVRVNLLLARGGLRARLRVARVVRDHAMRADGCVLCHLCARSPSATRPAANRGRPSERAWQLCECGRLVSATQVRLLRPRVHGSPGAAGSHPAGHFGRAELALRRRAQPSASMSCCEQTVARCRADDGCSRQAP